MERLHAYANDVSVEACRHIRDDYKFCISNTDDDQSVFQQLRRYILKLARTLKTWNTDYPLKFIQFEKLLQEVRKGCPIISFQQIEKLSSDTPKPLNSEELSLFLKFHHETRALVYFEDLPEYIILDTQWLSDAFKCIVTAEQFQYETMTFKNKEKWNDLNQRGILHSEVLEDIFNKEKNVSAHQDHILKVMEKFDIIISSTLSDHNATDEKPCYYIPCMMKIDPDFDIYKMFNVTEKTCKRSSWFCVKFSFLPPHLMNHLIASLCRSYNVAELAASNKLKKQTVINKQGKRQIAIFNGTAVFELQKNTKLQKVLVTTCSNLIQIQVWEFKTGARIHKGVYNDFANFVQVEINKIISTRFMMTNLKFDIKWECGLTKPEMVTGSNDFSDEQNEEYYCETCTKTHIFNDEWSKFQNKQDVSKV